MAQSQRTKPRYFLDENPSYRRPRMTLNKIRFYADTNSGRKPIEIDENADIQQIANQRQQSIIRFIGKNIDTFHPHPPDKIQVFTEKQDGSKILLKTVENPPADFITRVEDYADEKKLDCVIHRPDGSSRYVPTLPKSLRQRFRTEGIPKMKACPRCHQLACNGVGSTGIPCRGK